MRFFKKTRKKIKKAPIIETNNNILLPFNREMYLRIEAVAIKKINEARERLLQ